MKKRNLVRDLIVLWIAVTALVCAALHMHISINMIGADDAQTG